MYQDRTKVSPVSESVLSTNKVLRNTYMLLGLTLLFSGATAGLAMITNMPPLSPIITIAGYFGLLFITSSLKNSAWGILSVFALTGFLGLTLGPILNIYMHTFVNGQELIMMSLGSTGVIFFGLSGYAITTKKDFSFLGGILFVGILTAFILGLVAMVFNLPMLSLLISGAFILLSSGLILFKTSQIINGGENNYIMATVTLYISLYNIFLGILRILSAFSGRR